MSSVCIVTREEVGIGESGLNVKKIKGVDDVFPRISILPYLAYPIGYLGALTAPWYSSEHHTTNQVSSGIDYQRSTIKMPIINKSSQIVKTKQRPGRSEFGDMSGAGSKQDEMMTMTMIADHDGTCNFISCIS